MTHVSILTVDKHINIAPRYHYWDQYVGQVGIFIVTRHIKRYHVVIGKSNRIALDMRYSHVLVTFILSIFITNPLAIIKIAILNEINESLLINKEGNCSPLKH